MYESIRLTNKLQRTIGDAINTLKEDTNDFDDIALEYRIDKDNQIVISTGNIDGSTLKRNLYAGMADTQNIADRTIEIVGFNNGKPYLLGGDHIINDRQGVPKDWQTPLLKSMENVAVLMADLNPDEPEFSIICGTCGSDDCGILANHTSEESGMLCTSCGAVKVYRGK